MDIITNLSKNTGSIRMVLNDLEFKILCFAKENQLIQFGNYPYNTGDLVLDDSGQFTIDDCKELLEQGFLIEREDDWMRYGYFLGDLGEYLMDTVVKETKRR
ncbi:hypothetical protein AAGG74_15345 [Bacillus mexicanus]|uniref:hypothetical protein n=1 Tax=Bacillus mexicanus TaxID=2834415 RepID=UPI003D1D0B62